ncbi:MAG TPA: hypothetical protein VMF06_10290 [Candidatus Limnocylindria bacterium]|jgi:hypothetical protein|nr:hypothetical protein [Candidatus Limnocylindria bacterium]
MKQAFLLPLLLWIVATTASVADPVGQFEMALDIGNPKIPGSSAYDESTQTYTLRGGGYNIWFNHDEFHFLARRIKGDFLLTANYQLIGNEQGNGHRKTGWMIRESTNHDAVSINSCVHGDGLVVLQWRLMRGAYMRDPEEEIFFPKQYFGETIIQLERIAKRVTLRMAHPGEPLEEMGSVTLPELKDEVLIGPYVLAHDTNSVQEARVWNVRISTPVAPDWHPNRQIKTVSQDGLIFGNRLEVLDVATGHRRVLRETPTRIVSPAFGKNGKEILFEEGGQTFAIPTSGGQPVASTSVPSTNRLDTDGRFTYFSDGRTGTRQIWRRESNSTNLTQLTFELEHAWFPQVSPDGKQIIYLAYPHDANPQKPTAYQRVSLKLMPTSGGAPRTVAHFFGGKGSLENPCWSPDSTQIVFITTGEKQ